jgi:predicted phosphodiesterase
MAWISDNQGGAPFADVLSRILPHAVDVIGHAGDTVDDGAVVQEWHDDWVLPLTNAGNLAQTTPVLVARGNHDAESPAAYSYLWLPGNGSYYAETVGRTRLIVLNTNVKGVPQTQWLETELSSPEARDADFVIVAFHKLPFTNLWCDPNNYNGDPWVRTNWVPLFEQYGVDLVVSGHAHAYERGTLNGVVYTVVGGAGGALDMFTPLATWSHIDVALPVHHYAIMEVRGSELTWTAYDLNDTVIDSFELNAQTPIQVLPIWAGLALGVVLLLVLRAVAHRPGSAG